jgi:hypothetical protein
MDRSNPLFMPQLKARIENLEHTVEMLETRLSSIQMSNATSGLLVRLQVVTEEHLVEMKRVWVALTKSYALLEGCHNRQYPLFRPEIPANPRTSHAPQTMAAAPRSSLD